MGEEREAAWRALLLEIRQTRVRRPELVIADGAPGLEKKLARAVARMRHARAVG